MAILRINSLINYNDPNSLFRLLVSINIEALEELLEDEQLKEWDLLLENFQSSRTELKQMIKQQIETYKTIINSKNPLVQARLILVNSRWRNILMETLYILEEDFFAEGKVEAVSYLWKIFFEYSENGYFQPDQQLKGLIQNKYRKP